ncbi:LOW QUALITY PROTEIN: POL-like protein [Mya arenaria]|uniref:POL-like protein n=1 Tax=Mya arenaria TaxID=6604 RepID=A0ABY7G807_MYAAR|nr:LOW QUALITY PROTEIN: POL-like protein [Mya arenaria]
MEQLHSDMGREFMSHLFTETCKILGIDKTHTCPYRPQSNGLVERWNRTLKTMLTIFCNDNTEDWDDFLPFLLMAYRSTVHASTKCTPNLLMFGQEVRCPIDLMFGFPPGSEPDVCHIEYFEWLQCVMSVSFSKAKFHLEGAAKRQKSYYDKRAKIVQFEENSFVWRYYPPSANTKLGPNWIGPYLVVTKVSDLVYKFKNLLKSQLFRVDHLKPYLGTNAPASWVLRPHNAQSEQNNTLENIEIGVNDSLGSPERESLATPVFTRRGRLVKPPDLYSP